MCSQFGDDHLIRLHTHDNFWCQWVYQFSHEYCHHLINGKLEGELSGLKWFEETICELASMYHLFVLNRQWNSSSIQEQCLYAPAFRRYLNNLLSQNTHLLSLTYNPGWLASWNVLLIEPKHHRNHYNAIATKIFPLFVENPSLWKIILYFGDTGKWKSLQHLFDTLYEKAEDDYYDSVHKLYNLLYS